MPFCLTNAPAVFQWFIHAVFIDLLNVYVIVYLDNILIYSENKAFKREHVQDDGYIPIMGIPMGL